MASLESARPDLTSHPRIAVEGLSKQFGVTKALTDIHIEVAAGEVLGVIGLNGAGKTTLLSLMAGIMQPTGGRIKTLGLDRWRHNHEIRQVTTFLPATQTAYLAQYPYGHLRLLAQLYGLEEETFHQRVQDLMRQMDMEQHWHRPWTSLSLGMTKKAGLVGAFVPDAAVRILDEPFAGGIDPLAMESIYRWMYQARGRGETIIFSTQVLEQAEAICDRILVLERGRTRWLGVPDDLVREMGLDPAEPRAFARAFSRLSTGIPNSPPATEVTT